MIEREIIELLSDFRRIEVNQSFQFLSFHSLQDGLYNSFLHALLEAAEGLNLTNTTKFMAKKYLDKFLSATPNLMLNKLLLVVLTCLRVAIKFNEASNRPQLLTIDYCSILTQGEFSVQEFLDIEFSLINILGFRFRVTTPYDFLVVNQLLPLNQKNLSTLESIIDFTVSLLEARNNSAEEIFFAALLYCCRYKNVGQLCFQVIKATTHKWTQSLNLSLVVQRRLQELLSS